MNGPSGGDNAAGVEVRARALYERAIGLPPDERDRFLHDECARDDALRSRVELMLTAAAARTRGAALPQTEEVPSHVADAGASHPYGSRLHAPSNQPTPTLD